MPISADQIPERVAKQWARRLKDTLTDQGLAPEITLSQAQQCVARQLGYADWHAYQASLSKTTLVRPASPVSLPPLIRDDGVSLFTRDTLIDRIACDRGLTHQQAYQVMVDLYHYGLISYPRTPYATLSSDRQQYVAHELKDLALALPELLPATEQGHWENAPPEMWTDNEHHAIIPCKAAAALNAMALLSADERWVWETVARRFVARFSPAHPQFVCYANDFLDHMEPVLMAWLSRAPDEAGQAAFTRWLQATHRLKHVPHAQAYRVRLRKQGSGQVTLASALSRKGQKLAFSHRGTPGPVPALDQWFQHWHQSPPVHETMTLTWGPFADEHRLLSPGGEEVGFLFPA